jgi:iron complex outermembrane recepter protein
VREYRQEDARFNGVEADVALQLNDRAQLRVFGDTISGTFDRSGDVPRMPPSRVGAELTLTGEVAGNAWSAYATVIHAAEQDESGAFESATDAWTRFDVGADYTLDDGRGGEWLLFIKGRNVGDDEIRLSTSYLRGFAPEGGRSVEAGVRYRY